MKGLKKYILEYGLELKLNNQNRGVYKNFLFDNLIFNDVKKCKNTNI